MTGATISSMALTIQDTTNNTYWTGSAWSATASSVCHRNHDLDLRTQPPPT